MNAIARNLHIGAFDQVFPGWINADITSHIFVVRIPGLAVPRLDRLIADYQIWRVNAFFGPDLRARPDARQERPLLASPPDASHARSSSHFA